jgi:hypothetical protein
MATATKRRRRSTTPLRDELDEIYGRVRQATADRKQAGTVLREARERAMALVDQRQSLISRDRTLVDPDFLPVSPDNEVAVLDEQIKQLPDIDALQRRYDHAAAIEAQFQREAQHFAERHYRELIEELEPAATDAADQVVLKIQELLEVIASYKQIRDLNLSWAHEVQGLDEHRVVPGGDIIDLGNNLAAYQVTAPVHIEQPAASMIHDPSDPDLDHR